MCMCWKFLSLCFLLCFILCFILFFTISCKVCVDDSMFHAILCIFCFWTLRLVDATTSPSINISWMNINRIKKQGLLLNFFSFLHHMYLQCHLNWSYYGMFVVTTIGKDLILHYWSRIIILFLLNYDHF